jgi:siderophore synthetase component
VPEIDSATATGARAAVLARLWGALSREPLPGVTGRRSDGGLLTITLSDGRVIRGSAAAAAPFAVPGDDLAVAVDGTQPGTFTDPGELVRAVATPLGTHAARLAAELDNSVANLDLARSRQPTSGIDQRNPLVYFEQSVVDGHPLHPCARTRMGLSPDDVVSYAPEHRPTVHLRRVGVPPQRWYGVNCPPTLLLHPWQYERVRDAYPWLSPADKTVPAYPLMSLRTLALAEDPSRHVKTSVDIQMTSAVRTVSPASVHNGPALSRLLVSLADRVPGLSVLPEVGAGAAIVDGEPDRRLAMIDRRMPALAPTEVPMPLAALSALSPGTGTPIITELVESGYGGDPAACVAGLASVLLPPLFGWLALGVGLEAHGQNLIGVVRDGRIVRLLYRDFGGVRVSPARLRQHGIEPPPLRGDISSDDEEVLRTKVLASAVSTVLGEVVAVLGRTAGLDEEKAWHQIAAVAGELDGSDVAAVFGESLPVKATTAMRLADDPVTDIWTTLPNPLAGLR